jgi:hypothetical protein
MTPLAQRNRIVNDGPGLERAGATVGEGSTVETNAGDVDIAGGDTPFTACPVVGVTALVDDVTVGKMSPSTIFVSSAVSTTMPTIAARPTC